MAMSEDVKKECLRIGINILICRRRLKMQQEELSKLSGVSRSNISLMERGASNFKLKSLIQIADAMNVDYRVLLR